MFFVTNWVATLPLKTVGGGRGCWILNGWRNPLLLSMLKRSLKESTFFVLIFSLFFVVVVCCCCCCCCLGLFLLGFVSGMVTCSRWLPSLTKAIAYSRNNSYVNKLKPLENLCPQPRWQEGGGEVEDIDFPGVLKKEHMEIPRVN